jgi:hypothetical protein
MCRPTSDGECRGIENEATDPKEEKAMYTTSTVAAQALASYRREQIRSDFEHHRVSSELRRWNRLRRFAG